MKIDPTPCFVGETLLLAIVAMVTDIWLGVIHLGRPAYPGGGGLEKLDIYCYFKWNSIVKQGQTSFAIAREEVA